MSGSKSLYTRFQGLELGSHQSAFRVLTTICHLTANYFLDFIILFIY